MKNVRKTIVIVAATSVMTPFVTLTAAPDSPSTWRAIQITSSVTATQITISSTRRIVRARRSTTRSGGTLRSIALASDVVTVASVSLRTSPVVEHAALPGGGQVEVWVGIPDDP